MSGMVNYQKLVREGVIQKSYCTRSLDEALNMAQSSRNNISPLL
jgi:hypothetical protein